MSTRKVTRHEMKQDEFVSAVGRITVWAEENLMLLVWSAAGLLAAVGIIYGIWSWREGRILRGEAAFIEVRDAFEGTVGGAASGTSGESFATYEEKYRAVVERADGVIDEHGSTPSGDRARYYRGLALYGLEDWPGARAALEEFVARDRGGFLAPHARRKIAQIHEQEGSLAEACEIYRELSSVDVVDFPAELALMDLGHCLDLQGERAEAAITYRKIVDEHPDSPYAVEARGRLLELEG